jgi:hypothetical protein
MRNLEAMRKAQIIDATLACTIAQRGYANVTRTTSARRQDSPRAASPITTRPRRISFKAAFQAFFQRIFTRGEETMSTYEEPS